MFQLVSKYTPLGDQHDAIEKLVTRIKEKKSKKVLKKRIYFFKFYSYYNIITNFRRRK